LYGNIQIQKQEEVNTMTKEEILTNIAKERIGAETLETRNSDRLDFYDISVWALKEMLEQAYEAGRQAK
jgi:hypothetical protein